MPVHFYRRSDNRIIKDPKEIRHLLKTGEGRFVGVFQIRGRRYKFDCVDPETGKPATTFKEAEKIEEKKRQEVLLNTSEETITLAIFGRNHYLPMILQKRGSRGFYESLVKEICRSTLGPMPIRTIDSNDIEDYLMAKRGEITRRGTQRSAGSCNRLRAILSGIFKYARKRKYYIGENPVHEVERYQEDGRRSRTISAKEVAKLMDALNERDPILYYVAAIALATGMRRTEVCTLRWEWLDFSRGKRGYICLPPEVCKNKDGRKIPMQIPGISNARELLLELRGDEEKTEGAVFGLDPNSTGIRIANVCKSIGLKGVGLHVLRHTFATRCLDAGIHPFIVKSWLGHKSLAMTDYYSHVGVDEMENAMVKLEEKLSENVGKNGQEQAANVPETHNMAANSAASAL